MAFTVKRIYNNFGSNPDVDALSREMIGGMGDEQANDCKNSIDLTRGKR